MIRLRTLCAILAPALLCAGLAAPLIARRDFGERETARLHTHFARVLGELERRDVSALGEEQRSSRARLIALLREYDRAGRFPRNEGHSTAATPIFVDRHGTRCAMAYLIEHGAPDGVGSGAAIVARVAATANLARIHELVADPALTRWLAGAGLTAEEAARIQPEYEPPFPNPKLPTPNPNPGADREDHYPDDDLMVTSTLLSVGFAIPAIAMNLRTQKPWPEKRQAAVYAMIMGAQALAMGAVDGLHDGHLRGPGYGQLMLGATALTLAVLNLRDGPRVAPAAAPSAPGTRAALTLRSGQEGEPQFGVALAF